MYAISCKSDAVLLHCFTSQVQYSLHATWYAMEIDHRQRQKGCSRPLLSIIALLSLALIAAVVVCVLWVPQEKLHLVQRMVIEDNVMKLKMPIQTLTMTIDNKGEEVELSIFILPSSILGDPSYFSVLDKLLPEMDVVLSESVRFADPSLSKEVEWTMKGLLGAQHAIEARLTRTGPASDEDFHFLRDGWGKRYWYNAEEQSLNSFGADFVRGGTGDNADLSTANPFVQTVNKMVKLEGMLAEDLGLPLIHTKLRLGDGGYATHFFLFAPLATIYSMFFSVR